MAQNTKSPPAKIAAKPDIKQPAYTRASASTLSQTMSDAKDKEPSQKESKDWQILKGHNETRITALRAWRNSWWYENYASLAQYIDPARSIWLTQNAGGLPSPNNMLRGRQINNAIVDPTGCYAKRVCAAGMQSGLASPSRPWFEIEAGIDVDLPEDAMEWLDIVQNRMYRVLSNSNFYNSFAMECNDLVVYGTAPVIIYEDVEDIIRCYNPSVGEYYVANNGTMRVDTLARTFVMTVEQIVSFFGIESCPDIIRKAWRAKGSQIDKEFIVAHLIEPNFELGEGNAGQVKGNFSFRETYWLWGQAAPHPLSLTGFVEQPFSCPRWMTQSNDAYGRSVGMDVLPDIVQLQFETRRKAEGIEKQVRPPLIASIELKNQPSSSLPGQVTFVSNISSQGMKPIYEVNPDLSAMERDLAAIQGRIQKGFFNDLFLMMENLAGAKMTATEVQARMTEKMMVLGPVVENIISESLRPRLKRVYSIMARRGLFPPAPKSLHGVPLNIQFTSLLAVAQRAGALTGMERIDALIGNMSAVFPEVRDLLDEDKFVREFNDLLANPHGILRDQDAVSQIRQQRRQQAQAQAAQEAMAKGAQTAKVGADAANVLANTQIGAGRQSVLDTLVG